jgi:hypothetical protein
MSNDLTLAERLRSWAQNEEMVDAHYTAHGRDCNEAADQLEITGVVVLPVETVERVTDALIALIGCWTTPNVEAARAALRELATMTSAGTR